MVSIRREYDIMNTMDEMKKKTFDCVEMMYKGAERIRQQVEGLTMEEELAYWHQQTEALRQLKREAEDNERKV